MNWLERLRKFLSERDFRRGWDYAAGELLRGTSAEQLIQHTEGARIVGTYDSFDMGIVAAVRTYEANVYMDQMYKPFKPLSV